MNVILARFIIASSVALAASSSVLAQGSAAAPPAAPAQQPKPADAETVRSAESVLRESAKVYANAKAISDTIDYTATTADGEDKKQVLVAVQGADRMRIGFEDTTYTVVEDALFAERKGVDDKFAQFAIKGDLNTALINTLSFVPPQIIARGTDDPARLIEAWTFGLLPSPSIAGHSMGKSASGAELHIIKLASLAGEGELHIDAKSMLVKKATIKMAMEGAPETSYTLAYAPKVLDAITPAIAFDPGARRKVASLESLNTGGVAPDFTLEALDGSKVTLSELKGNVVVLDFWATWCGPCKRGLPKLNEFAIWARDNNKPVKVFGVDVWEQTKPEETRQAVSDFWTKAGYIMPTLLDLNSETATKFGYQAIPTTVVVGPDGKIFAVHTGFNPEMAEELKKNVEEALAGK